MLDRTDQQSQAIMTLQQGLEALEKAMAAAEQKAAEAEQKAAEAKKIIQTHEAKLDALQPLEHLAFLIRLRAFTQFKNIGIDRQKWSEDEKKLLKRGGWICPPRRNEDRPGPSSRRAGSSPHRSGSPSPSDVPPSPGAGSSPRLAGPGEGIAPKRPKMEMSLPSCQVCFPIPQ